MGKFTYNCSNCDFSGRTLESLKQHVRAKGPSNKFTGFGCQEPDCDYKTCVYSDLTTHQALIHPMGIANRAKMKPNILKRKAEDSTGSQI